MTSYKLQAGRVRMIDVANAAGVSRTTASFVLNGRAASIPEETQQRIQVIAEQMGYRPNSSALALATGRTRRIGIILNQRETFNSDDQYAVHVLKGITTGALRHNYNLLLHSAQYGDWRALRDDVLNGASDGTLLVGRYVDDDLTPALLDAGQPCVCISFHIEHPRCYSVDCDNELGAYLAAQHLLSLGHRQFALLYPGDATSWGRERRVGAERAIAEAGLPAEALRCFAWSETMPPQAAWIAAAEAFLLRAEPKVTATICCDEYRAMRLTEQLVAGGLRVPHEMAIVSFNSTTLSERAHPPLTSVWQPMRAVGETAIGILVNLIEQRAPADKIQRLPVRLDVRASTGAHSYQPAA